MQWTKNSENTLEEIHGKRLILQDLDISLNVQLRHYGNVKRTDKTMV